jgi:hydrogenase nickel incorporation protein HypA/HybF
MHDHAVMADLMRRIDEIVAAERAIRVARVEVWLGALSHMTPDHFAEHFTEAAAGGPAAGAALDITASDDIHDPHASGIVLRGIEVEGE